jgi:hypothetical protein
MTICECCGHPLSDLPIADPIAAKVDAFLATCQRRGHFVSLDLSTGRSYVTEAVAADLLNISPLTMRNRRLEKEPIPYLKLGRTPQYALEDLARSVRFGTGAHPSDPRNSPPDSSGEG